VGSDLVVVVETSGNGGWEKHGDCSTNKWWENKTGQRDNDLWQYGGSLVGIWFMLLQSTSHFSAFGYNFLLTMKKLSFD
jgi:hypothetical protein